MWNLAQKAKRFAVEVWVAALATVCSFLVLNNSTLAQTGDTDTVKLPDGSQFKTSLYKLKVMGQLKTRRKLPYYILSGFGCQECDANRSIYIHSPSDGPMKNEGEQTRFSYPGKETNYADGSLVYEARTFFGDCLNSYPNSVIWFERYPGEDGWDSDIRIVQVSQDRVAQKQLPDDLAKLAETRAAVRNRKCHEIPGINRSSEP